MTYHRVYNKSNTTVTTCGVGNAYPFGAPEFTPGFFLLGPCCSSFSVFLLSYYVSLRSGFRVVMSVSVSIVVLVGFMLLDL